MADSNEEGSLVVGAKVLLYGKHTGTIRYVPETRSALIGLELNRPAGDCDGTLKDTGESLFECRPNYGIFVREEHIQIFSKNDTAACTIQNVWRRRKAWKMFKTLINAATWNMLDNHQEQLNLKRAERMKSAEQTISMLANNGRKKLQNSPSIDAIPTDYSGPHLTFPLNLHNMLDMLESFKKGKCLHHTYLTKVLSQGKRILNAVPTLQEIVVTETEKVTIVGDIHGQLQDLFSIFTINGLPSKTNKYLFNGDFVDRGSYGVEVFVTMLSFKILYPDSVFLNRGNHESRNQNSWMGFEEEVWEKYDGVSEGEPSRASRIFNEFQECFDRLPLCSLVQHKIFVVHGGLFSRDNVTLAHLKAISRKREPPLHQHGFEDRLFEDILWSDPRTIAGRQPSERGAGTEFGQDVTNNFCAVNRVALIVRSHECVNEGFEVVHQGRLITLFSASRYCGTQMNKGAFLTLGHDMQPEIQQFYAHPMNETDFVVPEEDQMQQTLEDDNLRMIAERICDEKTSLFWYFTQHDQEQNGTVPRLIWAEALRSVLNLEIPFLNYQSQLAVLEEDNSINYSKFLARFRIENSSVDNTGWQEGVVSTICKKLYIAMGAGNMKEAFRVFDADDNGTIEYDEFMETLRKLDTGLSDQQIYELMRTADSNDDGRIDFKEFVQRFEVIFTDIHAAVIATEVQQQPLEINTGVTPNNEDGSVHPPPSPVHAGNMASPSKLVRKTSDKNRQLLNPVSAKDVDMDTLLILNKVGQAMFSQEASLLDLFVKFDINKDGVLQREEFFEALKHLGFSYEDETLDKIMGAVDIDGGDTIDYKEFMSAFSVQDTTEASQIEKGNMTWQQSVLQQVSNVFYQHRIHIRSAFRLFDRDNSGLISTDEFRAGINTFNSLLNSPLTEEQIEQLLVHLDKNKDGQLSYKEFLEGFRVVDVHMEG